MVRKASGNYFCAGLNYWCTGCERCPAWDILYYLELFISVDPYVVELLGDDFGQL